MQSLVLPRPTSLHTSPFGRPLEPENGLAKLRSRFSPGRPEQQSYPSPPMSESHSPSRHITQTSEAVPHSYSAPTSNAPRPETGLPLPPPTSGTFNPRVSSSSQGSLHHQRPLYPGEPQSRGQPLQYPPPGSVEHAPYGTIHAQQGYSYGYAANISPYGSTRHGGPLVQPAAMIPPSAARPTKPARRTKAHVASACVNCKKAHLSCDVQRPCGRCVASGKQDTCKDVQHKKRGRPRLRDDRDFSRPEEARQPPSQLPGTVPTAGPEAYSHQSPFPATHPHRASDPPRPIGRLLEGRISGVGSQSALGPNGAHSANLSVSPYTTGPNLAYHTLPIAFLNLDLVIQKSNQAFQELVSFLGDVRGKHLGDLLEARQNDSLQRLRNELRDERDERDPTYMAPITPGGQDPMRLIVDSLADRDVDHVSHGFTDRPMFLSFRLPNRDQYQSLQVQIRLAKTSLYFVTLVVRSPPRSAGPPLLTQQLAPPSPAKASQTTSAPAAAPARDYTPNQVRPLSSTSSAPSSPYFNFASVRTSLPTFSPSSYGSSPSYAFSPSTSAESSYFPTIQPPSTGAAYPSPYTASPRNPSITSEPTLDSGRASQLEGLHLPPIRTGAVPLGSPLQIDGQSASERILVRQRVTSPQDERRPETPETGKRRRLNIHEVLE